MRKDLNWFSNQAVRTWQSTPGRSFLLLVPYACNDTEIRRQVGAWLAQNFRPPKLLDIFRPIVISVTSDATSSSEHFVGRVARTLSNEVQGFDIPRSGYPSDGLEDAIAEAHDHKVYPVLLIERFH